MTVSVTSTEAHEGTVTSSFWGLTLGSIGVVGPTAMDYVSVMASVRAVAKRLSELATELGA